jgi:DNA-binding MarR family transcriptional regulator
MKTLTKNQIKALDFIAPKINWRPPTLREISEAINVADHKSVLGILKGLEKKGLVKKQGLHYYPIEKKYPPIVFDMSGTTQPWAY